jgi:hypothetical protein
MNVNARPGHHLRIVFTALVIVAGAACGGGSPSSTARAAASSYEQYAVESCAAWDALFRAVGNPDTATGSDLSRALDEAVTAGDAASAERLATDIAKELRAGREHIAVASGWQPRAQVLAQMDRMFAAYEAMIAAKLAAARREPSAVPPQAAFEQAGGVEAYFAWIEAIRAAVEGTAGQAGPCPNLPISP